MIPYMMRIKELSYFAESKKERQKRNTDSYDGDRSKAEVVEVGYFGAGQFIPCDELTAGMVGYITASLKNVKDTRVGDTVTDAAIHVQNRFRDIRK